LKVTLHNNAPAINSPSGALPKIYEFRIVEIHPLKPEQNINKNQK